MHFAPSERRKYVVRAWRKSSTVVALPERTARGPDRGHRTCCVSSRCRNEKVRLKYFLAITRDRGCSHSVRRHDSTDGTREFPGADTARLFPVLEYPRASPSGRPVRHGELDHRPCAALRVTSTGAWWFTPHENSSISPASDDTAPDFGADPTGLDSRRGQEFAAIDRRTQMIPTGAIKAQPLFRRQDAVRDRGAVRYPEPLHYRAQWDYGQTLRFRAARHARALAFFARLSRPDGCSAVASLNKVPRSVISWHQSATCVTGQFRSTLCCLDPRAPRTSASVYERIWGADKTLGSSCCGTPTFLRTPSRQNGRRKSWTACAMTHYARARAAHSNRLLMRA